jgi:hypothetical protein
MVIEQIMKTSRMILLDLSFYAFGVLLLISTNSQHIPLVILMLPFAIFLAALTLTILLVMKYISNDKKYVITRKRLFSAGLIACLPVLSLVLTSIGQFSLRSLITLLILFGIASFYVNRAT